MTLHVRHFLAAILAISACSKSDSSTPAAKATESAPPASAAPAADAAMTPKAVWDLAQSPGGMRKQVTVRGKVVGGMSTRVDIDVAGDQQLKLFFADDNAAKAAADQGELVATCTISGATPRSVRLENCTAK